jgi:hypothetical protein
VQRLNRRGRAVRPVFPKHQQCSFHKYKKRSIRPRDHAPRTISPHVLKSFLQSLLRSLHVVHNWKLSHPPALDQRSRGGRRAARGAPTAYRRARLGHHGQSRPSQVRWPPSRSDLRALAHLHGKRNILYFTPAAQMRFPLYPGRSAGTGTAQALHPVSRTWLRGGSPHRILKKLPVWAATLLRGCAGRRQSQPHLAPRPGGLERAIHVSVHSGPPLAKMRLRHAMRGCPCSCARSQMEPSSMF